MQFEKGKHIFLLGGHDLEMLEIRKMLESFGLKEKVDFFDRNLKWGGAKLSEYKDLFNEENTFVGIELTEDVERPKNYFAFDHHNLLPPRPTSIERVSKLMNFDISDRHYQLVIQNDIGHVVGMRSICATNEEIEAIRKADRDAQHLPAKWIEVAKEDVKNVVYQKDIAIIRTALPKTNVICDVFSHPKLIVYNEDSLNYYGEGALDKLKVHYCELLDKTPSIAYCGGINGGYFGVTPEGIKLKSLEAWINEIVSLTGNDYCFSTHAFMLPLRWDYLSEEVTYTKQKEQISFENRTALSDFNKTILSGDTFWKRSFFTIDKERGNHVENWNEYTYFHDYVRKVIFDLKQPKTSDNENIRDDKVMLYYEIETTENDYYEIYSPKETYRLQLKGISLHAYTTGVLIITFNLVNYSYSHPDDILYINEFGRRIYPQFLTGGSVPTKQAKGAFLACKIIVKIGENLFVEDFKKYDDFKYLKTPDENRYHATIYPPDFVTKLFSKNFVYNNDDEIGKKDVIRLSRITDDRMFFQCWYGNNNLKDEVGILCKEIDKEEYSYTKSSFWYAFLFGDKKDPSIANKLIMAEHLKKHSYTRWVGYGTIIGFTRDSFVCLSNDIPTLFKNNVPDLSVHMKTMYYQIAVLCLAQRASILRFSAEVTKLNDLAKAGNKKITEKIKLIYLNYIEFINKIYFREVTSQIQGIEMYSQFQEIMNINADVKNLDDEVEEMHSFAGYLEQEKQAKETGFLNRLAIFFLPASLIAAILGISFIDANSTPFNWFEWPSSKILKSLELILLGGLAGSSLILIFLYGKRLGRWFCTTIKMIPGFRSFEIKNCRIYKNKRKSR